MVVKIPNKSSSHWWMSTRQFKYTQWQERAGLLRMAKVDRQYPCITLHYFLFPFPDSLLALTDAITYPDKTSKCLIFYTYNIYFLKLVKLILYFIQLPTRNILCIFMALSCHKVKQSREILVLVSWDSYEQNWACHPFHGFRFITGICADPPDWHPIVFIMMTWYPGICKLIIQLPTAGFLWTISYISTLLLWKTQNMKIKVLQKCPLI